MKKLILAGLLFGSLNVFAQTVTPLAMCSNNTNDVVISRIADTNGSEYAAVEVLTAEGSTDLYLANYFFTNGQQFYGVAVNPNEIVDSMGVVGSGLIVEVQGTEAILALNGYIQMLTCTWN